jgi:predicted Fe-Mo cluster-binding NifX family protein
MIIAISATGNSIDSDIDYRFGRCAYFLIVHLENNEIMNVRPKENQGRLQGHGAGIRAAQQVVETGAEKIITGNVGPNAFRVLQENNRECYKAEGTPREAVKLLLENKLERITTSGPSHAGFGGE